MTNNEIALNLVDTINHQLSDPPTMTIEAAEAFFPLLEQLTEKKGYAVGKACNLLHTAPPHKIPQHQRCTCNTVASCPTRNVKMERLETKQNFVWRYYINELRRIRSRNP